jgi:hypothetical protein
MTRAHRFTKADKVTLNGHEHFEWFRPSRHRSAITLADDLRKEGYTAEVVSAEMGGYGVRWWDN